MVKDSYSTYMDRLKRNIMASYADKHMWKYKSDQSFTSEVASRVYHELREARVIPSPEKDFLFVSASANVPTHELAFFKEDRKTRRGRSTFLVGDLCLPPLSRTSISRKGKKSIFQYFKWDAEALPIAPQTADMIWDRKGWLWHAAIDLPPQRFFLAIHRYYEALKTGGSIVIDHADKEASEARFESEPSTVNMIRKCQVPNNPKLEETMRAMFEVKVIGSGIGRVNVLQKRTDDECDRIIRGRIR